MAPPVTPEQRKEFEQARLDAANAFQAELAKTERLRALRLARDQAERDKAPSAEAEPPKRKRSPRVRRSARS
jgi:hypothetical protein